MLSCSSNLIAAEIAEIADQLGFGDPAYFSRLFKKHCGVAPQRYRQGME